MHDINKARELLRQFGESQIPLIGYVEPELLEITATNMVIKIPLQQKTKNPLGSMYFGALAIGADLAGALQAFIVANQLQRKFSIVFKDFKADFIRRPESDVFFLSGEGRHIQEMATRAVKSGERVTEAIKITALTGYPDNPETIAEFALGLSIKDKE